MDLLEADRAAMLPLPPIPLHLGWRNRIRLGRDYYVRLDTNDYSVDPAVIGRMVDVAADLERVRVRAEGRIVADHAAGLGPRNHGHRPGACRDAPRGCANSSSNPAPLPPVMTWSGTWPTTTGRSACSTTARSS